MNVFEYVKSNNDTKIEFKHFIKNIDKMINLIDIDYNMAIVQASSILENIIDVVFRNCDLEIPSKLYEKINMLKDIEEIPPVIENHMQDIRIRRNRNEYIHPQGFETYETGLDSNSKIDALVCVKGVYNIFIWYIKENLDDSINFTEFEETNLFTNNPIEVIKEVTNEDLPELFTDFEFQAEFRLNPIEYFSQEQIDSVLELYLLTKKSHLEIDCMVFDKKSNGDYSRAITNLIYSFTIDWKNYVIEFGLSKTIEKMEEDFNQYSKQIEALKRIQIREKSKV